MSEISAQPPYSQRLQRLLGVYFRLDGAVFAVEAAVVSAATALMTLFIFLDLSFTFFNGLRVRLFTEAGRAGGLEYGRLVALVVVALFVGGLALAGLAAHPGFRRARPARQLLAVGALLAGLAAFPFLLVLAHPRVTCLLLVVAGAAYAYLRLVKEARAAGAVRPSTRTLVIWALTVTLLLWSATTVPDRYSSWAQPYALFLLLWTGFIGASMATSRGRHLKLDIVRKMLPPAFLGRYNFASYMLAAVLTTIFCYLSVRYTLARLGNPAPAGEIPDWLKVLAIPVSLFFISARFAARAILSLMGWVEPAAGEGVAQLAEKVETAP
jgi:TRAP-type C4-dicarboxylate transport system permease small subunit